MSAAVAADIFFWDVFSDLPASGDKIWPRVTDLLFYRCFGS